MALTTDDVQPLIEMIQELGYRAKFNLEHEVIESKVGGLKTAIFYQASKNIQFYCGMTLTAESAFDLNRANKANQNYRFAKFYIDTIGDLAIESDFLFDVERVTAMQDLDLMFSLWEGTLSFIREELSATYVTGDKPAEI